MFEGDSADTCAKKFPLVSMGAERRVSRAQTRERGPPSALAEFAIVIIASLHFVKIAFRQILNTISLNLSYFLKDLA